MKYITQVVENLLSKEKADILNRKEKIKGEKKFDKGINKGNKSKRVFICKKGSF